jgi:hypothetical protein
VVVATDGIGLRAKFLLVPRSGQLTILAVALDLAGHPVIAQLGRHGPGELAHLQPQAKKASAAEMMHLTELQQPPPYSRCLASPACLAGWRKLLVVVRLEAGVVAGAGIRLDLKDSVVCCIRAHGAFKLLLYFHVTCSLYRKRQPKL